MSRIEKLLESIKICDPSEVRNFLDGNPDSRKLSNSSSALMVSLRKMIEIEGLQLKALDTNEEVFLEEFQRLKANQIEIYELLVSRGFNFAVYEDFASELNLLGTKTKIKLKKIHNKFLKDVSLKHITTLMTRCKLSHTTHDSKRSELNLVIARALEELNAVPLLEPILKVAASADKLSIIFDFGSDSVENVDPTASKSDRGIVHFVGGDIYIGARKLLLESQRFEVLGHLIHELAHFAIERLYRNDAKPYKPNDELASRFEEILEICEAKQSAEDIISVAFRYAPQKRHTELIARVPHLLAHYMTDQQRLNEVKATFPELFEFYETKTAVDLDREHPLMESRNAIKKFKEWSGLQDKLKASGIYFAQGTSSLQFDRDRNTFISSNCPRLTMQMIYQEMNNEFVFIKLETILSDKFIGMAVEALSSALKPILFVDCETGKAEEITKLLDTFSSKGIRERIVLVQTEGASVPVGSTSFELKHLWQQLAEETQAKFMKTEVNFQDSKLPLAEVLSLNSEALQTVPLQSLLSGNLTIGKQLDQTAVEFYVDREFSEKTIEKVSEDELKYMSPEELMDFGRSQKVLILSDDPGMGKTIEMKLMAKRIKSLSPASWVLYVDLKHFIDVYDKERTVTNALEASEDVVKFYCNKIMRIEGFEAQVFAHLYEKNSVVFLLDGFDEISPRFKQFNKNLLATIRQKSQNQLWVATRPHLQQELQELLDCKVFKMSPFFGIVEKRKFIEQLLIDRGFDGARLEMESHDILSMINDADDLEVFHFSNPVLMRIIIDLKDDLDDLIMGKNCYPIYRQIVLKIVEKFLRKGAEARNEVVDFFVRSTDVMAFHQRKAVESVFIASDDEIQSAVWTLLEKSETLQAESMARVGLLLSNNSGGLKFVHRTFEDFFVVEFFNRNFTTATFSEENRAKAFIELFRYVFLNVGFDVIKNFFEGLFILLNQEANDKKLQIVKRVFKENFSTDELFLVFHDAVAHEYKSTIKMIPVADVTMNKADLRKLWLGLRNGENILMTATRLFSIDFVTELLTQAQSVLDADDLEEMFFFENEAGESILSNSFESSPSLHYFIDHPIYSLAKEKTKKFFMSSCEAPSASDERNPRESLFMKALLYQGHKESWKLIGLLSKHFNEKEFKCILSSRNNFGQNIVGIIAYHFRRGSDELLQLLREKFTSAELKEMASAKDYQGHTPLMLSVWLRRKDSFDTMWSFLREIISDEEDFKSSLLEEDNMNFTVLTNAAADGNDAEHLQFVLSVYKSFFSYDQINEIILKARSNMTRKILDKVEIEKE